jgi:hypothetical protein
MDVLLVVMGTLTKPIAPACDLPMGAPLVVMGALTKPIATTCDHTPRKVRGINRVRTGSQ